MQPVEFELKGDEMTQASGNVEVTLPSFMVTLHSEELEEIKECSWKHRLIVAAGRKRPDDDDIIIMTAEGQLLLLNASQHDLPNGKVTPAMLGSAIAITSTNAYCIDAGWVIVNSKPLGVGLGAATYGDADPTG